MKMLSKTVYEYKGHDTKRHTKRILIISGVHGNETSALAVMAIFTKTIANNYEYLNHNKASDILDVLDIKSIRVLTGVNESGIIYNTREYVDSTKEPNKDINRAFSVDENIKEPTSFDNIISEIKNEIKNADVVIDVHNSYICRTMFSFSNKDPNATASCIVLERLANNFGMPISYYVSSISGTIKEYTNSFKNKYGFTVELEGVTRLRDTYVATQAETMIILIEAALAIVHVISKDKYYKVFGDTEPISYTRLIDSKTDESINVTAPSDGLFVLSNTDILHVSDKFYSASNHLYNAGETIGIITDYEGNVIDTVRAPAIGYVVALTNSYYTPKGGSICLFQPKIYE